MSGWHAIRTSVGAQLPRREYTVDKTETGKGYRISPSLNTKMSAIERALNDIGVQHYMPAEFRMIRNRKKTGIYELRRFALIPGYVFVHGVTDWLTLRNAPGVAGIVAIDGVPLQISIVDIITLRTIEAMSQAHADRAVLRVNSAERAQVVRDASKAMARAKRMFNPGACVKIMWGDFMGKDATISGWDGGKLKAIVAGLDAAVSVAFDHVKLVA